MGVDIQKILEDAKNLRYEDPRNPTGSNQKNSVQHPGGRYASDEKIQQNPDQDLYDDARSNGIRAESHTHEYEKTPQKTIKLEAISLTKKIWSNPKILTK